VTQQLRELLQRQRQEPPWGYELLGDKRHGRPLLDAGKRHPALRVEHELLRGNTILPGDQELCEEQMHTAPIRSP
jgi:hypothetical protein